MAKTMKFTDSKTYDFTDSSTALDCVAVVKTFAELDAIRAEFTEENLKGATFDGVAVGHIVPLGVTAATDGDNITAHFTSRKKSLDEINAEQISELQEAVAGIVEGARVAYGGTPSTQTAPPSAAARKSTPFSG